MSADSGMDRCRRHAMAEPLCRACIETALHNDTSALHRAASRTIADLRARMAAAGDRVAALEAKCTLLSMVAKQDRERAETAEAEARRLRSALLRCVECGSPDDCDEESASEIMCACCTANHERVRAALAPPSGGT